MTFTSKYNQKPIVFPTGAKEPESDRNDSWAELVALDRAYFNVL